MSSALLILQPFRRFTYVTTHSPTLPSLYLRPTHSPTLPSRHLRHSSFSNHSFASLTSQALHLRHLASCPWKIYPEIINSRLSAYFPLSKTSLCCSSTISYRPIVKNHIHKYGVKGGWDFRISDVVKNPNGTDI